MKKLTSYKSKIRKEYKKMSHSLEKKEKKEKTPSFTATLRLKPTTKQIKTLLIKGEMARMLYNACLGEALNRLKQIKETDKYQETIKIDKTTKEGKEQRRENFKELNKQFGFNDYSIQAFGTKTKNQSKFIAHHLGTHVCQKIATRAFKAVQKVALGKARKVKFKRKGEFVSLEGKNNKTFLTYNNGYACIDDMTIPCRIAPGEKDPWMNHALNCRVKYCRLICNEIKGKPVFYLQLILEGIPYEKYQMGTEETGFDIGPSTIAVVSDSKASLEKFCEQLPNLHKEKRRKQRKLDRQRRANNPNNYHPNGTVKKGKKKWVISNTMKRTQQEYRELERKIAATRKTIHGTKANDIFRRSQTVKTEKLSYKAFQKLYGKSVARCAPATFIKKVKEKIERNGGTFLEIPTVSTKLSQTCHKCKTVKKKKLSQRWHDCTCGVKAQRDLYSAFLAKCVTKSKKLSFKEANKQWVKVEELLNECMSNLKTKKKENNFPKSFGI